MRAITRLLPSCEGVSDLSGKVLHEFEANILSSIDGSGAPPRPGAVVAEDHNCKLLGYKQDAVWILQCGRVADDDDDRR
jgi:hypothetical protein